ncbi:MULTISPECIES: hypothetical protein [unclassified Massilia]|uniref:hypothetical protein n=1 Tax=unclassified Massilia TaxID=2609279 RepID=UPI0013A54F8E|nr:MULTISPECIES: hypothetical protein [unclassified Massilia]
MRNPVERAFFEMKKSIGFENAAVTQRKLVSVHGTDAVPTGCNPSAGWVETFDAMHVSVIVLELSSSA